MGDMNSRDVYLGNAEHFPHLKYTDESSLSAVEVLLACLHKELEQLHKEAEELADEFWSYRNEGNEHRKTEDQSKLGIRAREKTKIVTLEWCHYRWNYHRKGSKPTPDYIKKGREPGYQLAKLMKYAKDWERDFVEDIETRATRLREQSIQRVNLMNVLEKYIDTQT